jgi:predicted N-acetyltransferase YhbS
MVGSALWNEQDGGLYLGRLAVVPAWRGRGVAKALVAAAEEAARRMALPRIHLSTRLVLFDNRRLFAACGFVESACHPHRGYAEPTFVIMEKRLVPPPPEVMQTASPVRASSGSAQHAAD